MKKGKLITKDKKYYIKYLDSYSGRDNGGYEKERVGYFELEVNPEFPIDTLEYLLNEEVEFERFWYVYESKDGCRHGKNVANIKLSVQQNRDIKISQIRDNKINEIIK